MSKDRFRWHSNLYTDYDPSLAYCELYLTLATVFAPGGLQFELFETDIWDVETPHDYMNPGHRAGSKGIRVRVK